MVPLGEVGTEMAIACDEVVGPVVRCMADAALPSAEVVQDVWGVFLDVTRIDSVPRCSRAVLSSLLLQ